MISKSARERLTIGAIGALAGATYLPLTLQILIGSGFLDQVSQSVTVFFFPVCWATFGLGFLTPPGRRPFVLISAMWLAAFLFTSLATPLQIDSYHWLLARLVLCLIPACAWYFSLGRELNRHFSRVEGNVHVSYGMFMLGLALGYVVADVGVPLLGGNGILLLLIIIPPLIFFGRRTGLVTIPVVVALTYFFQADLRIERLRNVGEYPDPSASGSRSPTKDTRFFLSKYADAFDQLRWNRRGQTWYGWHDELKGYHWFLNLEREHFLPKLGVDESVGRRFLNRQIRPEDRTLLIGVGSGRSLNALPRESLGPNIFAIERDSNTVNLITESRLNPLTSLVNYIAADGRGFLEKSEGKWDWIIIESALDQSRNLSNAFSPNNLYTKEAIDLYLSRLSDTGTLVIEIRRFQSPHRFRTREVVVSNLEKSGYADRTTYLASTDDVPRDDSLFLSVTRKTGPPVAFDAATNPEMKEIKPIDELPACLKTYGDSAPFLQWLCMEEPSKRSLNQLMLGGLLLFIFFATFFKARSNLSKKCLRKVFLLQGLGQTFAFIAVCYKLRSIFVDEIFTFYVFTVTTTLIHAAAAFWMSRLHGQGRRPGLRVLGPALGVSTVLMFVLLSLPQVFEGPLLVRAALFLGAVAPFYFLSSLLFNESLQTAVEAGLPLREAFMFDALAVIPAYALLPLILFEFGIGALAWAAVAAFALSFVALICTRSMRIRFKS